MERLSTPADTLKTIQIFLNDIEVFFEDFVTLDLNYSIDGFGVYGDVFIKDTFDLKHQDLFLSQVHLKTLCF